MSNKIISLNDARQRNKKQQPKSSRKVVLVITCALSVAAIGGYMYYQSRQAEFTEEKIQDNNIYQNNAYNSGLGYYHASAMTWYPYPWGTYDQNRGYFYDGQWSRTPQAAPGIAQSMPLGVARKTSTDSGSSSSSSTKRGGFGSGSHSVAS